MFQGLGNLASAFKQAQALGSRFQALTEELKSRRATGSAGAGLVEVEVNGLGEALRVKIDPALIARQDIEMLEELLPAAINQAQAKAKQLHAEAIQSMAGGMDIPGLGDMLAKFGPSGPAGG